MSVLFPSLEEVLLPMATKHKYLPTTVHNDNDNNQQ